MLRGYLYRLVQYDYGSYMILKRIMSGELDGMAFTTDVFVDYFNLRNKWSRQMEFTRVRTVSPVFYFQKNSILSKLFNEKIDIALESGLTLHWLTKYKQISMKNKAKAPKKLDIPSLVAVFEICAVLCLINCFVFAMELLSQKYAAIKRIVDYLTY